MYCLVHRRFLLSLKAIVYSTATPKHSSHHSPRADAPNNHPATLGSPGQGKVERIVQIIPPLPFEACLCSQAWLLEAILSLLHFASPALCLLPTILTDKVVAREGKQQNEPAFQG